MTEVGIRALKQNASAVVTKVAGGETVTITDRGRPVAQMVPLSASRMETLIKAGTARPALRRLSDLRSPARRRAGQPTLSDALAEMRQAEQF